MKHVISEHKMPQNVSAYILLLLCVTAKKVLRRICVCMVCASFRETCPYILAMDLRYINAAKCFFLGHMEILQEKLEVESAC